MHDAHGEAPLRPFFLACSDAVVEPDALVAVRDRAWFFGDASRSAGASDTILVWLRVSREFPCARTTGDLGGRVVGRQAAREMGRAARHAGSSSRSEHTSIGADHGFRSRGLWYGGAVAGPSAAGWDRDGYGVVFVDPGVNVRGRERDGKLSCPGSLREAHMSVPFFT